MPHIRRKATHFRQTNWFFWCVTWARSWGAWLYAKELGPRFGRGSKYLSCFGPLRFCVAGSSWKSHEEWKSLMSDWGTWKSVQALCSQCHWWMREPWLRCFEASSKHQKDKERRAGPAPALSECGIDSSYPTVLPEVPKFWNTMFCWVFHID